MLTLALACLLTPGWLRSENCCDIAFIPVAPKTELILASNCGLISLALHDSDGQFLYEARPADRKDIWEKMDHYWRVNLVCVLFGEADNGASQRIAYVLLPYSSNTAVLTMLSAWMLLSKGPERSSARTPEAKI